MFYELVFRTVVVYFFILIVLRLTVKREIGQLSPFDFVVAIIIAEVVSIPIIDLQVPLWHVILPVCVLAALEFGFSWLILINRKLRLFVYGKPQIITKNGKILLKEMKKARYNLDDLITQLREKGIFDIKDVETGILEYTGKLSVLLKPQKRGVTTEDLGIDVSGECVPVVLVMDRKIINEGLRFIGQDEKWLLKKLEDKGFSLDKIFLASLTADGDLFISEHKQ